jgi:hypothetical protein
MKYEINIPACSSTDLQEIKRDIERVIYNHTGCATILKKANVSGSLPLLDEYREYVVRTGLLDRKTLQDWVLKRQ